MLGLGCSQAGSDHRSPFLLRAFPRYSCSDVVVRADRARFSESSLCQTRCSRQLLNMMSATGDLSPELASVWIARCWLVDNGVKGATFSILFRELSGDEHEAGVGDGSPYLPAVRRIGQQELPVRHLRQGVVGRKQPHGRWWVRISRCGEVLGVHPQPLAVVDDVGGQEIVVAENDRQRRLRGRGSWHPMGRAGQHGRCADARRQFKYFLGWRNQSCHDDGPGHHCFPRRD